MNRKVSIFWEIIVFCELLVLFLFHRHYTADTTIEHENSEKQTKMKSLITLLKDLDATIRQNDSENLLNGDILRGTTTPKIESYINAILEFNYMHPIKTVCEVGFAGGHSATLFLHSTEKSVTYTAFDKWDNLEYDDLALNWVKRKFPDRHVTIIKGDAEKTVPEFEGLCDVIHISDTHHAQVPLTDLKNMHRIASENNLLLINECTESMSVILQDVKLAFGIKKHVAFDSHQGAERRWCIGHYKTKQTLNFVTFLDEKLCTPSWQGPECEIYVEQNPCSQISDECFYNDQSGVLSVCCNRWHSAQNVEKATWVKQQRTHARNEMHAESYDYYESLPDNLGDIIEIGSGPFTQTQTILKYHQAYSASITLLEPMAFHYMLHAKYCFYPNGTFKDLPTTLLAVPAEDLQNSRQFDTLVMINVIEHVYDALSILETSINVIKEGGLFIWHERLWDDFHGRARNNDDREFKLHPIRIKTKIAKLVLKMFDPIYESWDTAELRRLNNQGVYFIGRRNNVKAKTNIPVHVPCFNRSKGIQTIIFFVSISNSSMISEQITMADRSENTKRIILIMTEPIYGQTMLELFQNKKIEIMLSYQHLQNWKREVSYYTTPCSNIVSSLAPDMLNNNTTICIGHSS